jgi:hypothetical protein
MCFPQIPQTRLRVFNADPADLPVVMCFPQIAQTRCRVFNADPADLHVVDYTYSQSLNEIEKICGKCLSIRFAPPRNHRTSEPRNLLTV